MAIVYLDVDDEITTAAARIRTASDLELALVLPAGSRIATSRINFRLLAHEAAGRSRRLAIVAPEGSTRALAATAGIPVFATVPEYEEARDAAVGDEQPEPATTAETPAEGTADTRTGAAGAAVIGAAAITGAAAGAAAGAAGAAGARSGTGGARSGTGAARSGGHARPVTAPADAASPGAAEGTAEGPAAPVAPSASRGAVGASTGLAAKPVSGPRRRSRWPLAVAALVGVALIGGSGAAVGYVVLPTASVTVEIVAVPVGPIAFEGTADPTAVAADPVSATVPATSVEIPLAATGTFKATGKRVEASAATGRVRWTNCDPTRSYTLPKGTLARTPDGVAFSTQESVFLPVAILDPPRITCSNRTVDVLAQREGPAGNVAAGSITVVPGSYDDRVIRVTNLQATSGGAREVFPQVTEKDVAAAEAALAAQLDAQLAEVALNPPGVPVGATVYPETAERGDAVASATPEDLVGQEVETFDLTLTASGSVVAADPSPLEAIGLARIEAEVPDGMELREGSAVVEVGDGIPEGQVIRYPVTAEAEAVREVGEDEVRDLVRGKTVDEAEAALAPFGSAIVVLWPDWATTVTTLDPRLEVTIVPLPPADAGPGSAGSPAPTAPLEQTPPPASEPVATAEPDAAPTPGDTPAP